MPGQEILTLDQQAAYFRDDLANQMRRAEMAMADEWGAAWQAVGARIEEATRQIAEDQAKLEQLKRSLMGLRGDKKTEAESKIARLEATLPGMRAAVVRDQVWQDEIAVKLAGITSELSWESTIAQQDLVEAAQMHGIGLIQAGWRDRVEDLRREVAAKTHGVMDVVWGPHKVGVPGKGDWAIAKKQGLYTTRAAGQRLYAQTREDALPLIQYLKAGGEYGTPEFSRLLGYTEDEILQYRAFLQAQRMASIGAAVGWNRPSVAAIEHLVGRTMDGGRLADRFKRLGEETWAGMRTELVKGMALGQNPERVVRSMKEAFAKFGMTNSLRLARTEMINSYRQASLVTYNENADIISGYRWCAELGPRTCQACIALHGTEFLLHDTAKTKRWGEGGTIPGYDGSGETTFARAAKKGDVELVRGLNKGGMLGANLVHHKGDGHGVWKGVSSDFLDSHENEVTGYRLGEMLLPGEGLVPETVLLKMRGGEGSSQFFIENARLQKDLGHEEGKAMWLDNRRRADAAVALDFIQDQRDRHHANWIYDEDGVLYVIDNGFAQWEDHPHHQLGTNWLQSEARRAIEQEEGIWAFSPDLIASWRDVARVEFDAVLAFRHPEERDLAWQRFEMIRNQGKLDTWSKTGKTGDPPPKKRLWDAEEEAWVWG